MIIMYQILVLNHPPVLFHCYNQKKTVKENLNQNRWWKVKISYIYDSVKQKWGK